MTATLKQCKEVLALNCKHDFIILEGESHGPLLSPPNKRPMQTTHTTTYTLAPALATVLLCSHRQQPMLGIPACCISYMRCRQPLCSIIVVVVVVNLLMTLPPWCEQFMGQLCALKWWCWECMCVVRIQKMLEREQW
jgi:hypothetical protein